MSARLMSQSAMGSGSISLTEQVAYFARVSNPSNQESGKPADGLIKYLIENRHWSPFEMVTCVLEIVSTRDIVRQILRHRSFSFQEFSQRYADPTKSLALSTRGVRLQDRKNRQNSVESSDAVLAREWTDEQERVVAASLRAYKWATDRGIAREVARSVLPEGMMESRIYMSGTLRSWMHYIQLRSGNGTQLEHRVVARECADAISPVFPQIVDFITKENS